MPFRKEHTLQGPVKDIKEMKLEALAEQNSREKLHKAKSIPNPPTNLLPPLRLPLKTASQTQLRVERFQGLPCMETRATSRARSKIAGRTSDHWTTTTTTAPSNSRRHFDTRGPTVGISCRPLRVPQIWHMGAMSSEANSMIHLLHGGP